MIEVSYIALGIADNAMMAYVITNHQRRRHRVSTLNDIDDEIDKFCVGGLREVDDIPLWKSGEGKFVNKFPTKKTWMQLRARHQSCTWSKGIWFSQSTPKYSFMLWIAIRNRLQTRDKMQTWNFFINAECIRVNPLITNWF